MACPEGTDSVFIQCGLLNLKDTIQIQCLDILTSRVASSTTFAFKIFTPNVVKLLNSPSSLCSHKASDLLVMFFKNSKDAAKADLARQLHLHNINEHTASSILQSINYNMPSRVSSSHTTQIPSDSKVSVLSIQFLLDDPMYALENVSPEKIISVESFKREISEMAAVFEGKETEFNWQQRDKNVARLRSWLRGNGPKQHHELLIWAFKHLSSGILKGAHSLRTTLSSSSCQLVKEMAIILKHDIDFISDIFISSLIKLTALSKKITHTVANITVSALYANTSYSFRALNYIPAVMNEKNIQPRVYSAKWLRIIIYCHRNVKSMIESSGGRDIIETCIFKGLSDASPGVREEMRLTFWAFNEVWPSVAQSMLARMESSTRKILEKSNPQPSASIPFTMSRPSRTGSSIKSLISQSRERNILPSASRKPLDRSLKIEKPTDPPKDLTVKAARLGITQKAQRRIISTSSNSSASKTTPKFGTRDAPKISRPSSSQGNYSNLPSSPPESFKERKSPVLPQPLEMNSDPTLTDQIKSDNPEVVTRALRTIVKAWINPHEFSVELPSTQLLDKFFKHLFSIGPSKLSKERWELIHILTDPNVVTHMTQFVSVSEVALGIIHTQPENLNVLALKELFNKLGSDKERVSLSVYIISNCLQVEDNIKTREAVIDYCLVLLKEVHLSCPKSKSIRENIKLLESALNSATPSSPTLEKFKLFFNSFLSKELNKEEVSVVPKCSSNAPNTSDTIAERAEDLNSEKAKQSSDTTKSSDSLILNSPDVTEDAGQGSSITLEKPAESTPQSDSNHVTKQRAEDNSEHTFEGEPATNVQSTLSVPFSDLSPSASLSVDFVQSSGDQVAEKVEPDTAITKVDELETHSVDESEKHSIDESEKHSIDKSVEHGDPTSDNAMSTREDIAEPVSQDDVLMEDSFLDDDKQSSESTRILDLDTLRRTTPDIEIFHDSADRIDSPVTLDPTNSPNSKQTEMDWLKTETALNSLSLLSNESESISNARNNNTIDKLIVQLGTREISNHGLNKLVSIVKDLDSKDFNVWKENGWLNSLRLSLFRYLDVGFLSQLTADQANKALLLVNYLLIFKNSVFSENELQLLNILFKLHDLGVSDKRSLIRGVTFVRNELMERTDIVDSGVLLQASLKDYDDAWSATTTTPQHKVFLLSTFEKIVTKGDDAEVLSKLGDVVLEGLRAKEAIVRKQAYSLMLHLVKTISDQAFVEEKLLSKLKDGERRLFEYYQSI